MTHRRALVLGGGVAGMAAAAWLHELELSFSWWMGDAVAGGTLRRVGNPVNALLGLPTNRGADLVAAFTTHMESMGVQPTPHRRVSHIRCDGDVWRVAHSDGDEPFDAVLLATGTRPRQLGLDGEAMLMGRGVEQSVTRTRHRYRNARCLVVGGGDAALEGALLLAEVTDTVTVVHRGRAFGGQARFEDRVLAHPSIEVLFNQEVVRIEQTREGTLAGVVLSDGRQLDADGLFIRIGVEPSVPTIAGGLDRDDAGYIVTSRSGRTSRSGLYAAGDVTGADHQSIAAAQGDAARAVAAMADDRLNVR